MIGERLKLARTASGLSLRDLADKIDNLVSAQAIGKYERNEMSPGSEALIAMAEALSVSEEYLLSAGEIELVAVDFRRSMTSSRAEAILHAKLLHEMEKYLEIEDRLVDPVREWVIPKGFPCTIQDLAYVEVAASDLRTQWGIGSDLIPDLSEFFEERGLKVFALDLEDDMSGVMCRVRRKSGADIPVIVINSGHDGERQRFTLVHELAHLLLEVAHDIDEERACDRFAGAFLMPKTVVTEKLGRKRTELSLGELFALKMLFGASIQAIVYRCKDLGIIDQPAYRAIYKIIIDRGWRKKEPHALDPEVPTRFRRLCYRALTEGLLKRPKAAELLGISIRELEHVMNADGVRARGGAVH
jgi:Zn-dependent peptidase ImmA (M78 family)